MHCDAPDPTAPARQTLNTAEAAHYIGYGPDFLKQGRLGGYGPPFVRFGRSIRYRVKDLDQWQEAHRVVPRDGRRQGG